VYNIAVKNKREIPSHFGKGVFVNWIVARIIVTMGAMYFIAIINLFFMASPSKISTLYYIS
jgi:hypothetical protein